jgi:hypothetical protein
VNKTLHRQRFCVLALDAAFMLAAPRGLADGPADTPETKPETATSCEVEALKGRLGALQRRFEEAAAAKPANASWSGAKVSK